MALEHFLPPGLVNVAKLLLDVVGNSSEMNILLHKL